MFELGVFGIDNNGVNTAVKLLVLFLVVIWLALVYYTYADATRRIEDPMLIGCATIAALFPFVGTIVYTIVRPTEYLEDVRERELEMAAAEAQIGMAEHFLCPHCDYRVQDDFLRCPSCMRKLKDKCVTCAKPLDPDWRICPYCETEVAVVPPPAATPRRRRRRADEEPQTAAAAAAAPPQPEADAMAEAAARAQAAAAARARARGDQEPA